jgi:hypothetical protein
MQAFPVRLRSGAIYWTVLDDALGVVAEADAYLQQLRFGPGCGREHHQGLRGRPGLVPGLVCQDRAAVGVGGAAGVVHDLAAAHPGGSCPAGRDWPRGAAGAAGAALENADVMP